MVELLALTAMIQASPVTQARVTIRVLAGAVASRKEWERTPTRQKRKITIKDETGRRLTVYAIEFQ